MWQFLQTYGAWIIGGLFFLLMLRMHAGGMGHGAGHDDHTQETPSPADQAESGSTGAGAGTPVGTEPGKTNDEQRGCCG